MRKLVSSGITALVLGGVLLAGGSPATAAPSASAAKQTVQQVLGGNHEYYDWYWTRSNCNASGTRLMVSKKIWGYECALSPYLTWYLYVWY